VNTSESKARNKRELFPTLPARINTWFKRSARPALNRFLARYSLVGDPILFDTDLFPWTRVLEENYEAIRDEAERLLSLRDSLPAFHEVSPYQQRISDAELWKTVWLHGFGHTPEIVSRLCPATAKLIGEVPGLQSALFSILAPGTHIPAHRGVYKGLLNDHLGLIVPKRADACRIRVGDESFHWEAGQSWIFDDTNEHEVWNETGEQRAVLFLQFDRPLRAPGRQVSELFLWILRRTPYLTVPFARSREWEERLRSAAEERGLLSA
jgi:aspartyl/asparaginyl beta-hydroxylase (cupin superfamily)